MIPNLRLLPFATADGPTNMAADEALLLSAAEGVASLRFYTWSPATLSLGYFQPVATRFSDDRLAALPWVRRASGGATLVHDREITYALALPAGLPWQTGQAWIPRFHGIVRAFFAGIGLGDDVSMAAVDDVRGEVLCFQKQTVGDLVCQGHKIGGSAQRKHRGSLLQHGSILLRQSPWTPALPGIFELTGLDLAPCDVENALVCHFAHSTQWTVESGVWTGAERRLIDRLVCEKFGHDYWNDKR